MNNEQKMPSDTTLFNFLNFIKLRFRWSIRHAVFSLVIAFLLAAIWFLLPAERYYQRDIAITLQSAGNKRFLYPNGQLFHPNDLIGTLVLSKVYRDNQLESFLPLEQFIALFSISDQNWKTAGLEAEFLSKLQSRNLKTVEIQQLEDEFRKKQEQLSSDTFRIIMREEGIPPMLCDKILNDVPRAWFELYSVLEARTFPASDTSDENLKTAFLGDLVNSRLISLERAKQYAEDKLSTCLLLNAILEGRNVSLPTGEYLGDLINQLNSIRNYRIALLRQAVCSSPKLKRPTDLLYVQSRLQTQERELIRIEANIKNLTAVRNMLQPTPLPAKETGKGEATPQLNVDGSFFSQIAELVRNDANSTIYQEYAKKLADLGEQRARLLAEQEYYRQLLPMFDEAAAQTALGKELSAMDEATFNRMAGELVGELSTAGTKISRFKEIILKEYQAARKFYTPMNEISIQKTRIIPASQALPALLGLWIAYNLVINIALFIVMKKRDELD